MKQRDQMASEDVSAAVPLSARGAVDEDAKKDEDDTVAEESDRNNQAVQKDNNKKI